MRVSLINPPVVTSQGGSRELGKSLFFNSPPLGLAYLAGVLEREGIPVQVVDAAVERMDYDQAVRRVRRFDPDVIGLTATTFGFGSARELARRLRERIPQATYLVGGPHVTHDTHAAVAESPEFDLGVVGEGEELLPALLRELDRGAKGPDLEGLRGLAFRVGGEVRFTGAAPDVKHLDTLPFPARHLLPLHLYKPQPVDQRELPKAAQVTSRGCPYHCTFCEKAETGYRSHSPERIVDEMVHLAEVHGARDVAFVDSMFAVSRKRLDRICDEMERRAPLPLTWTCTVRANSVTREMLARMKANRCWRVRLGIESGSPRVLRLIKKDVTLEQVRDAVTWADALGLQPKAFFIVGHYGETEESLRETLDFAKSIPLSDVTVQLNTPLKGTEQYELVKDSPGFKAREVGAQNFFTPAYLPDGMSEEQLVAAWHRFYREFYLRPVTLKRHLREIRRFSDVQRYMSSLDLVRFLFVGSGNRPPQEV
ncbi:B12-binding domain-containing radical SAM protein [Myxococcota bacterium]|nr:B12-binding domain-containing radical SAM protein [Myxococcota bacterium]